MNILDQLNSGQLHAKARSQRPDCVDAQGNIHISAARANFVDWKNANPNATKSEYSARYVPSH
jgi:hypothetical protein